MYDRFLSCQSTKKSLVIKFVNYILLALLLIVLLPLGTVHLFDWDEINFAEAAREMVVTGDYLRMSIDFQPFYEKPPLFIWMQAAAMQVFGINEYAARFPNLIAGLCSLLLVFKIGKRLYNPYFGWLWLLIYVGSILPQLYFHSGIIDPWFNLFIFAALYYFLIFHWRMEGWKGTKTFKGPYFFLVLSALCLGLAILTKGPVAYLIISLCFGVYWIYSRFYFFISILKFIVYTLGVLLLPAFWFGVEYLSNGADFIIEFFTYQIRLLSTEDAGHGGFLGYHFVVLFIGCFPAAIFALRSFFKQEQELKIQHNFKIWMKILFWVVLILFSLVQSKIVHYSSLAYFPITYLATLRIYRVLEQQKAFLNYEKWGTLLVGLLISAIVIAVPLVGQQPESLQFLFAKDPFALANLEADVWWQGWEMIAGIILLVATGASFYYCNKAQNRRAIYVLFTGCAIFVTATIYLYINNIEGYSQRAAINFYQNLPANSYVIPYGYKSYAHLFYTQKTPQQSIVTRDKHQLLTERINGDVFVITKVTKTEQFEKEYSNFTKVGEENGFVFYKKK